MLLLLSESELLQQESLSSKNIFTSWHFKGTRPQNSSTQRVRQFIELATSINYNLFDGLDNPGLIKQVFRDEIDRVWNLSSGWTKKLSSAFIDLLLINAVAPYLWYCAEFYQKTYYHDLAIDLLLSIAPEKNSIIKKWYPLNVIPLNAFESQGLIGLYRYYCCRKKCLSCSVGQKLLNR